MSISNEEDKRLLGLRITPLNRRRLINFKNNKRGYWSFWLFLGLFTLSLFAEFIANDTPYLVYFKGEFYFPTVVEYPETIFGGDFPTEADYKDPFVQELIETNGWLAWPLITFSYSTIDRELGKTAPSAPDSRHWLGTDDQARDVLARLIYGFRLSVSFGLILTFFSSIVGIFCGRYPRLLWWIA
jgi:microcin C transport system permease protein